MQKFLDEDDWDTLLQQIHHGQVVPVIGPAIVTIPDEAGQQQPLYEALAQKLAIELGLPDPDSYNSTSEVAAAHVLSGRRQKLLCPKLHGLLKTIGAGHDEKAHFSSSNALLPPSLDQLARIHDFKLFLGTTPDHCMQNSLSKWRSGFDPKRHRFAFHPKEAPSKCDLPTTDIRQAEDAYLYQLLGDVDAMLGVDFAVWEEDLMEFVYGLITHADAMTNLFNCLKKSSLLLLGAPADDWTVRYLLRVVRGERLSTRSEESHYVEYIAENGPQLSRSAVLYFDQIVKTTHLLNGDPNEFVNVLFTKWQATYGQDTTDQDVLDSLPRDIPFNAVFISYANEDLATAKNVAKALQGHGVPVWLDRRQLQAGQLFDERLQAAISLRCSLFIALVSRASESSAARYVHREREWAAQRQGGLTEEFYLPVLVDIPSPSEVRLEPEAAMRRHFHHLTDDGMEALARRVKALFLTRGNQQ